MKLPIYFVLLAILAMLATAAPHPDMYNRTHMVPSSLYPRTGVIKVELGLRGSSVGDDRDYHKLVDNVTLALRHACPSYILFGCENGFSQYEYPVPGLQNGKVPKGILYVTIMSAYWGGYLEVYDILIDAIAGTAALGAGRLPGARCWDEGDCTTYDRIFISFKGYHMRVALESSYGTEGHDCWKPREQVEALMYDLRPRMEAASGDGDLYPVSECV